MFNRAAEVRARVSGTSSWPAPAQGWVQSGNVVLAPKQQAEVLDNFIPTAQGIRLRGGASEFADIGASIVRMFTYASGGAENFFGATATGIYDLVKANTGFPFPAVSDQTSGDWSATQIGTSGGQFLVAVNGADDGLFWDGAKWVPLLAAAPNEISFNWLSADWVAGETVTGGTSGATATILSVSQETESTGKLIVGAITSGPFTLGEEITATGADFGRNLATYSEQFDNAAWTKTFASVTANSTTAPDGTSTADTLQTNANIFYGQMIQNFSTVEGTTYTLSIYAKANSLSFFQITLQSGQFGSILTAGFSLSGDGATVAPVGATSRIESVGSGWYRCSITATATAAGTTQPIFNCSDSLSTTRGGITGTTYIWGAQIEEGDRATKYEPTTSAARTNTRALATANSAAATSVTLTNIASSALSQVWLFKRRLFFVEKDTTSAWYLPVDSIGGAAVEFDLGANFRKGGSLLFGATWSLDSGEGLDDVCLFVSDQGEVAVYEGTDPSDANAWRLAGVYDIGKPLDKHAWFKTGGDLAILTEGGIIPASEALRKDRAALQTVAVSFPIEDAWKEAIQQRTTEYPVNAILWQSGGLLVVGTPATYRGRNVAFLANAQTGAWARVTGWDVRCQAVFGDELYFANSTGKVLKADSGGNDDGLAYTGVWVPKFEAGSDLRTVNAVGITYRATEELMGDLDAHADYNVSDIAEPAAVATTEPGVWGSGVWGVFVWGGDANLNTYTGWQAAFANGYAVAPSLAITSNQLSRVVFEPLILRTRTETGYAL